MNPTDLTIRGLKAGYGAGLAVQGIDLRVPAGSVSALLGRNGAGKTTTLMAVMGLVPHVSGSVSVGGNEILGRSIHAVARHGVAVVPQGRRLFPSLSVEETLRICAGGGRRAAQEIDRVYQLMPRLAERVRVPAGQLSGGEQQMLSIGRALLTKPRILLLDEPSDGLSPAVVAQVRDVVHRLCDGGVTVLLVEQDLRTAFELAAHVHVMAKGRIVHTATTDEFRRNGAKARELLGVGA